MKIFVTGGSGFIGRELVQFLTDQGHQLTILSRGSTPPRLTNIGWVHGDPTRPGPWQREMREHQAVINLAGASVFCRWARANRRRILDSRLLATRNVVEALAEPGCRTNLLINGSAVGYYGDGGDRVLTEASPAGAGFLAEVAAAWEAEANQAAKSGTRVVCCRLGVVLGRNGGALAEMLPIFRAGFGTRLGSGRQWFPWIHLQDLARIVALILNRTKISGPVNCVAPEQVTNAELTRILAGTLRKPLALPAAPAWILRLLRGEASDLMLSSLRIKSDILPATGFSFNFPTLPEALANLLARES
jgi:hypothetical protein